MKTAAPALLLLVPLAAFAQQTPPVSESVVVTATSAPEEEKEVGSATTVITRDDIEKSGRISVLELLRSVPGLDVVQSGAPGSLTSVFTRGTNSTHTLVLVDGARMNSPFFPGYDFSGVTTENIERIEIVRGPFSALYGSDAVFWGGVAGACVATFFTFLPSFVFILLGGPLVEGTREDFKLAAPLTAVTAAVVGVILNLALFFAAHVLWPQGSVDWIAVAIAAAALVALVRFEAGIVKTLAACAVAGLAATLLL